MTLDESLPTTDSQAGQTTATTSHIREINGRWEKFCTNCDEWIGLGPKGGEGSFLAHQRNKRCSRTRQRKVHQEAKGALESLVPSFATIPPPFPSSSSRVLAAHPYVTSGPSYSPLPATLSPSDSLFLAHPPPSPTPFPLLLTPGSLYDVSTASNTASSLTSPTSSHLLPIISTSHAPQNTDEVVARLSCDGVKFKWEHASLFLSYPLQYHETRFPTWSLDGVGEQGSSHMIRIRSHSCTQFRDPSMEACFPCTNVISSQPFQNILKNVSKDPSPNTPYIYLNWNQLETKLRCTIKELQLERKQVRLLAGDISSAFSLCL